MTLAAFVTALATGIGALPFAFLFVKQLKPFLPVGPAFAGGAMVWLVARGAPARSVRGAAGERLVLWLGSSLLAMSLLQLALLGH